MGRERIVRAVRCGGLTKRSSLDEIPMRQDAKSTISVELPLELCDPNWLARSSLPPVETVRKPKVLGGPGPKYVP